MYVLNCVYNYNILSPLPLPFSQISSDHQRTTRRSFPLQLSYVCADVWRDRPAFPTPLGRAWISLSLSLIRLGNEQRRVMWACHRLVTVVTVPPFHRAVPPCHTVYSYFPDHGAFLDLDHPSLRYFSRRRRIH